MDERSYDAVVVGAGPNGLAAAVTIARAGRSVLVVEAADRVGGGTRSDERTLPGFVHDVCSAVHPLAVGSPFFAALAGDLSRHGLTWAYPEVELAHPLDGGDAVAVTRSVADTAAGLGKDAKAYRRIFGPLARHWNALTSEILGPLRPPRHPLLMARFGMRAVWPAATVARRSFSTERARALFAGLSGHAILPLERAPTAAFGLLLGASAHAVGWPVARGGSQAIADALASLLRSLGGEIVTGRRIASLGELPPHRTALLDLSPRALTALAGERLPAGYRARLARFRHGPGVFKADYALDGPVPWENEACRRAGTVHVGGTFDEIAEGERAIAAGRHPDRPLVLVAQQSIPDPSRAPSGKHTLWAYCHVPAGSTTDMSAEIEDQIERFAPGFSSRILERATMNTAGLEAYNPNYVGGDIAGGAHDGLQLLARPVLRWNPYSTPADGVFLCSASTPPGAGVHGMGGAHAARAALQYLRRTDS